MKVQYQQFLQSNRKMIYFVATAFFMIIVSNNSLFSQNIQTDYTKLSAEAIIIYNVSIDGSVNEIKLLKSSGDTKIDQQAIELVKNLKYPTSIEPKPNQKYVYEVEGGVKKNKTFPKIELNKLYSWRSYYNNKIECFGYYIFKQCENGQYKGVQLNSFYNTNWLVNAVFSKHNFVMHTQHPWNETWSGLYFDGETIYGTLNAHNNERRFELDIKSNNKIDSLIEDNINKQIYKDETK